MKKLVPISFTDKPSVKNQIRKMAKKHGTNRSWMTRLFFHYALENMPESYVYEAVLSDLKSQARVIDETAWGNWFSLHISGCECCPSLFLSIHLAGETAQK